ncbi:TetR/AcrR family transcriptional regulator [Nonomuraea soli]|uniref:AcrR family transcriptional regulator n=1 Tax=Nonomuraea soli TaxID=1032476 RepID=A0A7W0CKB7_9ACTN|nr:TetR/AcrR family transcriptional regulator [Nonomuraea soli]MBA2892725.1 AcrR family transcriptional regulator [Nonomuraea soli]
MPNPDSPIPSVWTRPPKKAPALSREQIVAAAMKLLDTEGLEALSLRRLGVELGAAATAFYRHVANKDELIELVVNEVYGELRIDGEAPWRESVTVIAHSFRAAILRHPWFVSVIGEVGLAYLGPNVMGKTDQMLAVLERAGFALEDADLAMTAVLSFVVGHTTSEAAWLTTLARSGRSEQEWMDGLVPVAEQAAQPYPALRRLFELQRRSGAATREDSFAYGLELILDSLERRMR